MHTSDIKIFFLCFNQSYLIFSLLDFFPKGLLSATIVYNASLINQIIFVMLVCVFIFVRKVVVFVIAIQRYLCNGTFCKSLLSCGDAVVLLVAGKRWLSQPDQESKRSYWEEPCHILVSFLCPSLPYNTLINKLFYVHLLHNCCTTLNGTCHELILRLGFNNLILEGI